MTTLDRESWERRARLAAGGLLAAGCRGAVLLAGHGEDTQVKMVFVPSNKGQSTSVNVYLS